MKRRIIIFTSLLFFGCNTSKNNKNQTEQDSAIIGLWEIHSVKEVNQRDLSPKVFEPMNDSTFNLVQFFGAVTIKKSTGKLMKFTKDNRVVSNIFDSIRLKELDFRYSYNSMDSIIKFSILNPRDSSKNYIPTKTYFDDSYMVWNVDDFIIFKLKKIK